MQYVAQDGSEFSVYNTLPDFWADDAPKPVETISAPFNAHASTATGKKNARKARRWFMEDRNPAEITFI